MSIFDGIEDAKLARDSEFIRPGRYICRVDSIKTGVTRKNVGFVSFNLQCLHVIDDTAAADDPKGPHRVGDRITWMVMKTWDTFLSTVKTSIRTLAGCSEDEVTAASLQTITSESQPMAGMFCEIDSRTVLTKAGGRFTVVTIKRPLELEEVLTAVPSTIARAFNLSS